MGVVEEVKLFFLDFTQVFFKNDFTHVQLVIFEGQNQKIEKKYLIFIFTPGPHSTTCMISKPRQIHTGLL